MPFDTEQQLYYRERLSRALNSMSIALTDAQIDLLLDYLSLLEKWNKAFNLTAVRDTDEIINCGFPCFFIFNNCQTGVSFMHVFHFYLEIQFLRLILLKTQHNTVQQQCNHGNATV